MDGICPLNRGRVEWRRVSVMDAGRVILARENMVVESSKF
jgi:hypothetical protein